MKPRHEEYRVGHGGYVSEFTQFLNRYTTDHPTLEEDQLRGWYIWWDHQVDFNEIDKERKDTVPDRPYHYE
ncbi:MAG: DUF3460 family protein [Telluria sp.]